MSNFSFWSLQLPFVGKVKLRAYYCISCSNLFYLLILLTLSSLLPDNQHLLSSCLFSIFFHAELFDEEFIFPLRKTVYLISRAMSLVCRLNYRNSCLTYCFSFLDFLIFAFPSLAAMKRITFLFFFFILKMVAFFYPRNPQFLRIHFRLLFLSHSLSMSSFGCKTLRIIFSFESFSHQSVLIVFLWRLSDR